MEKELECVLLEDNYGAQYQNYFLSIALTNPRNKLFVYENYIELSIKHERDHHIDYAFDGIYTCDRGIMNKFIIRGPVQDLRGTIRRSVEEGCYVILNINEQFLPNRQAYHRHYFRHDLLIIGFSDQRGEYITMGFDANMQYAKIAYEYSVVEEAYYKMQNEWDFEVFVYHFYPEFHIQLDRGKIKRHLENYLAGNNPNKFYWEYFLENSRESIEFVNNNYVGEYYGISVYDYLIKRIKNQYRMFHKVDEEEKLGVLDLRSLNTLRTHSMILRKMLLEICSTVPEEIVELLTKNEKSIMGVKLLILKYFSDGDKKNCRRAVERLEKIKQQEQVIIGRMLDSIEIC